LRVLVINLTRMGDLIQTIGLLNAIKKKYPDAKTDLLVMSGFYEITRHFDNINMVYSFDNELFNPKLKDDFWDVFSELFKIVDQLNLNNYDLLLNPIVSKQSALLAYLINAKEKKGMLYTTNNEQKISSDFIAYHLANQHQLGDHCLNLVDIFAGLVGQRIDFSDYNLNVDNDIEDSPSLRKLNKFLNRSNAEIKKIVGIHIGASQSNKAWDVSLYFKLIKQLVESNEVLVILFGGYNEIDYKSIFSEIIADNFLNTIGDYKLNELIFAINQIDLMVTNDTGPMHIATTLKKPIIDISLGPVSKWETAPYSENTLIIEANIQCHPCSFEYKCPHWDCHYYIDPELVYYAIFYKLDIDKKKTDFYLSRLNNNPKINLFVSRKDIFNFQIFYPLFKTVLSEKEYIFEAKRFVWALTLSNNLQITKDDFLRLYKNYFDELSDRYQISKYKYADMIKLIQSISKYILNIIVYLEKIEYNKKSLDKIKELLLYVKRDKQILFNKAKEYQVIYDWFWFATFKESEIEDENINQIARSTKIVYNNLYSQLQFFSELLNYNLLD